VLGGIYLELINRGCLKGRASANLLTSLSNGFACTSSFPTPFRVDLKEKT